MMVAVSVIVAGSETGVDGPYCGGPAGGCGIATDGAGKIAGGGPAGPKIGG
jgi:hypothetical protein